jgi:hypothetical protein
MRWKDRGCAALCVAMGLCVPPAAEAATASQSFTTAGEHAFVVPPGVHSVQVLLVGASGGLGAEGEDGGTGATLTATLAVTPGEPLYAEVGGVGGRGDTTGDGLGGFNGGGPGGDKSFVGGTVSAAGGGGSSDVRAVSACTPSDPTCAAAAASVSSLASRLLVAAGGGGGGGGGQSTSGHTASGGAGGAGDAPGKAGQSDLAFDPAGAGGEAGTPSAGGAAGTGAPLPGEAPAPGTSGAGGQGAYGSVAGGGGGGGGGINGGGGGGGGTGQAQGTFPNFVFYEPAGGGGGGGASTLPPGPPGASNVSLLPTANPQASVTFTWILPVPAGTTLPATAVTSSGATLNGTVNPNDTPLTDCHFAVFPAPPGGSMISCAQQVGSGGTPVAVTALLLGLNPLTTYTARLVAGDAQGTATGAPVSFTTLRAGLPAPPGISKLSVTITRRHGRRRGSVKLTLSQAATLAFGFERSKSNRWVTLKRTMTARVRNAGSVTISFRPKGLAVGRYRLTVVATNAVGERSGPQRATFTIKR